MQCGAWRSDKDPHILMVVGICNGHKRTIPQSGDDFFRLDGVNCKSCAAFLVND